MIDLSRRRDRAEVMDDPDLPEEVYRRCLTDLASVNRWTMTHRATLAWLAKATAGLPRGSDLKLLDVAYGDGDLLRAVHRWATKAGLRPVLAGIDLNPRSARIAAEATPPEMLEDAPIDWRIGDVFLHDPSPPPDFIVSSQFTHHLADDDVVAFLRWLEARGARGWFIADLHRHVVPYYAYPTVCRLMGWHDIVRDDGLASIIRSFRRADWVALLARAGIEGAAVRWAIPFRFCVGRLR